MVAQRRTSRSSLEQPLLSSIDGESTHSSELSDPSDFRRGSIGALDMVSTTRDKISLALIGTGLALFLPLTIILVWSANPSALGWFAPHPPLNALAITLFVAGVVPVQPPTPPAAPRAARLALHKRVLGILAVPAMWAGTSSMWYNKEVHGADHFTTWHGCFGALTLLWMNVQALIGGLSVWYGGSAFGGGMKAKRVYKYHRISGYLLITLSLVTAFLAGMYSTWATGRPGMTLLRVAAYALGLPLIFVGLVMRVQPGKMKVF